MSELLVVYHQMALCCSAGYDACVVHHRSKSLEIACKDTIERHVIDLILAFVLFSLLPKPRRSRVVLQQPSYCSCCNTLYSFYLLSLLRHCEDVEIKWCCVRQCRERKRNSRGRERREKQSTDVVRMNLDLDDVDLFGYTQDRIDALQAKSPFDILLAFRQLEDGNGDSKNNLSEESQYVCP